MPTNYSGTNRTVTTIVTSIVTVTQPQATSVASYAALPGSANDKDIYFTIADQMYWIYDAPSGQWLPIRSVIFNNYGGVKDSLNMNPLTGVISNNSKDEVGGNLLGGIIADGQLDP